MWLSVRVTGSRHSKNSQHSVATKQAHHKNSTPVAANTQPGNAAVLHLQYQYRQNARE